MVGSFLVSLVSLLGFQETVFLNTSTQIPSSWVEVGKPPSDTILSFGFLFTQKNTDILENLLLDRSDPNSDNYGNWLSRFEIDLLVGSNLKYFDVVTEWLSNTISTYGCLRTADSMYCKTTVANINNLFNTKMFTYKNNITKNLFFSGRKAGYTIPTYIRNFVELVIGIGDFPEYTHRDMKTKKLQDDTYYISPLSITKLYNISDHTTSVIGSQSVVEFQNDACFNLNDLNYFLQDNNLPTVNFTKSHIFGNCDLTTSSPDIEATLDIQYQLGVNTNTLQEYVSVSDWLYQFANILYNIENPPLVNSMSYGWAENDQCDPNIFPECYISGDTEVYTKRTNIEFMKLALRGITLVASSGDAGAAGRTNEYCTDDSPLNPVFPTSSPYVLSVGGTVVMNPTKVRGTTPFCKQNNCIGGGKELNCNHDRCGWTSGGGFSNYFNRPWWQEQASDNYLKSSTPFPLKKYFNRMGRVYPDISVVSHNYMVRVGGNYMAVDGTSASGPVVSAMISMLNNLRLSQGKSSLGAVAPLLYDMYNNCPDCYNDVTQGDNNSTEYTDCKYGYTAAKGFDAVYGVGIPNFDKMYAYVKAMKN